MMVRNDAAMTYSKFGFLILGLLFFAALPGFSGSYMVYLVTLAFIFSIFALAYDLLFGYTGIVSFGHSIFYGVPAYAVGMVARTVWDIHNPLVLMFTAIAVGALLGAAVGFVCTFVRGIYLAIVTFALAQIFALLVLSDPGGVTLGENGVMGVRPPPLVISGITVNLFAGTGIYYVALVLLLLVYVGFRMLVRSQWGDVFRAIQQNEQRLMSLGYNTRSYKVLAFALSGGTSAIAGCLMVFLDNFVSPSMVEWHVGAHILLITILGGAGTLTGPVLGAFVVVFTESYASSLIGGGNWVYVLGGLYIFVAMFLPGGIIKRLPLLATLFQHARTLAPRSKRGIRSKAAYEKGE